MKEMGSVAVDVPVAMRDPASVCVIDAQRAAHDRNVRPREKSEVCSPSASKKVVCLFGFPLEGH
jgi:hypothetical protein